LENKTLVFLIVEKLKVLTSITKKGEIERASRPPCGFWRIDDQQLEVYPFAKSFVEYFIQKGI
jgi:hypothetical protein